VTAQLPDNNTPWPRGGNPGRLVLHTILQHIRGATEDQFQEVKEKEGEEDKENRYNNSNDQLPGVGNTTPWSAPGDGAAVGNRPANQTIACLSMHEQGWTEYNPEDPMAYSITYAKGVNKMKVMRWVRTIKDGEDTWIKGMEGQGGCIYWCQLCSRPYPTWNFNNPHNFRDNWLMLLHLAHHRQWLVNWALGQLADRGLSTDIRRYQAMTNALATVWAKQAHLNTWEWLLEQ
jgi:hypothetical protein